MSVRAVASMRDIVDALSLPYAGGEPWPARALRHARRTGIDRGLQAVAVDGSRVLGAAFGGVARTSATRTAAEIELICPGGAASLRNELLAFVETAARRLGVHEVAIETTSAEHAAAMHARGYSTTLFTEVGGAAPAALPGGEPPGGMSAPRPIRRTPRSVGRALPEPPAGTANVRLRMTASTAPRGRTFVVAYHPRFAAEARADVAAVDPKATVQPLAPDTALVEQATPGRDLADAFAAQAPRFVRRLAPADLVVDVDGTRGDLAQLVRAADRIAPPPASAFRVDCIKGPDAAAGRHEATAYTVRDVEIAVGSHLEWLGRRVELDDPRRLVHVHLAAGSAFVGEGPAGHAVAALPRRLPATMVSRAEHKLREACLAFGIRIDGRMRVLDLGAAPGGWALVAAQAGASVDAVDPADLAPLATSHPRIVHHRCRAEDVQLPRGAFDLVVDDMGIDPDESCEILRLLVPYLRSGAEGVVTLKLPTRNVARWLAGVPDALGPELELRAVRHLFHNRQEVTAHVALRRRD